MDGQENPFSQIVAQIPGSAKFLSLTGRLHTRIHHHRLEKVGIASG
jgi:hypothetical protein